MATVFPDPAERSRIESEMRDLIPYARRQQRLIAKFVDDEPTRWDDVHFMFDRLLEDWQATL